MQFNASNTKSGAPTDGSFGLDKRHLPVMTRSYDEATGLPFINEGCTVH